MIYQRKSSISDLSVTEGERFYTPYHNYNTRLSARLAQNPENKVKSLYIRRPSKSQNEDTYLIEQFENSSDRFSAASSNCLSNSLESLLEIEDRNYCEEYLQKSLVKFELPVAFMHGPESVPACNNSINWLIRGVIIACVTGWCINGVRLQFTTWKAEVNGRIDDIVDARLDTLYKLSEVTKTVKELVQSQDNFRFSIQKMIENEINKIYSDKTGRTDFALESAGGRIVRLSSGTENYGQAKSYLGIQLCEGMHGPRAMIQAGTSPGECWALKGSSGGVIVKLLVAIKIDAVSVEHISKSISPSGDSKTAPKDFTVWGLRTSTETGTLLGQFSYQMNGPLVQMFPLTTPGPENYEFVELKILSNHGNSNFTCVYRFRVHGRMEE